MMYELLSISTGEITVIYATENKKEIKRRYRGTLSPRLRIDGRILTIREATAFVEGKTLKRIKIPPKREQRIVKEIKMPCTARAVEKIDAQGSVIAVYRSITQAVQENYYVNRTAVLTSCSTGMPTANGDRFRYAEGR